MLQKGTRQGARAPQKHAAVPEIISCAHELSGASCVWFFGEAAHAKRLILKWRARLDVAIPGFSASRANPQHHNVLSPRGDADSILQDRAISGFVSDDMVGRKQPEYRAGVRVQQYERRQAD